MTRTPAIYGVAFACALLAGCALTGEQRWYRARPDVVAPPVDTGGIADANVDDTIGIDAMDASPPDDALSNTDVQRIADAVVLEPDVLTADAEVPGDALIGAADTGGTMTRLWTTPPGWVSPPDVELTAVWAAPSGEVWIGGLHGTMYFKSGTTWTPETLPVVGSALAPRRLSVQSLWGTERDVWAACTVDGGVLTRGVLLRRARHAGASWATWGGFGVELNGVYFAGLDSGLLASDDTYVYGLDATRAGVAFGVLNTRRQPLLRIAGYQAEEIWVVGGAGNVVRFGNSTTSERMLPPGIGFGDTVTDVFVGSGTPRARAVVSSNGALDIFLDGRWFVVPRDADLPRDLRGVWISPTGETDAVGALGVAIRVDSSFSFRIDDTGTRVRLNDVFGVSRNDVWAVGEHGTVLHRIATGF